MAACMASAPLTLVPFHSLIYRQVAEGLSADTDSPAQPSAKTIHRASSRLCPRAACITTAIGTLILFHSVHVPRQFTGPAHVRPSLCFALPLHLGNLVPFHSMLMCKSTRCWAPTPTAQLNPRPRQFTGLAPGRTTGLLALQLHL